NISRQLEGRHHPRRQRNLCLGPVVSPLLWPPGMANPTRVLSRRTCMRRPIRSAFSLVELLVVLACLTVALGLSFPAVVKAREQAKKGDILNSLKQLCLAAHNYHDANNNFPMGCDANNFSAAAYLLPYLEEEKLFKAIDFNKSVTDAA